MNLLLQMFPPELQSAPGLFAGFLALLGLILCATGVKVARGLAAALTGAAMATLAACVLPGLTGLEAWLGGIIGLVVGLLLGAAAFRVMQGVLLALCLGILAAGTFYQWQAQPIPPGMTHAPAVLQLTPGTTGARVFAALPPNLQTNLQAGYARWEAIPQSLRQSMVVVGIGMAILALAIAWAAPRPTTWAMSATVGALLLLLGINNLMIAYLPTYAQKIPTEPEARLVILAAVVAAGMLVQRLYFWPKKGKPVGADGEPAAA
jgi:hypothetical protein